MKQLKDIVSIIVCTYNQEKTICRTLDAILAQHSPLPFEVIIGDDCSTDGTTQLCRQYAESHPDKVRLFSWSENKGVNDNYYSCVREARGKYIMECGGDDEWCQGRIALCLDIMDHHPDVIQVFTDVYFREEKTGNTRPSGRAMLKEGITTGKDMIDLMFHQRHDQMACYAMTRTEKILEVMEQYPQFFTGKTYLCEDKQLKILIATKGDIYYSPVCTYYYTIDTPSITHNHDHARKFRYEQNMIRLSHDLANAIHYDTRQLRQQDRHFLWLMLRRAILAGPSMKLLAATFKTLIRIEKGNL